MATITGLTAERMIAIEDASVVDGAVVGDNLILYQHDGSQIDVGNVRGPAGEMGPGPGSEGSILYTAPGPTVAWSDILKFRTDADGKLEWGNGVNPVDTNFYRGAANQLKTDDDIFALGAIRASADGTNGQITIGDIGTDQAGINFGASADVNLYRSAANVLKTDDELQVVGNLYANRGVASEVYIGLVLGNYSGIIFGSAQDTYLYRSAYHTLKTDYYFESGDRIYASVGSSAQTEIGAINPGVPGIMLGDGRDASLYRKAAGVVATNNMLAVIGNNLFVENATADATVFGTVSAYADTNYTFFIARNGAMSWGPGGAAVVDTNLYRSQANRLRTDDSLVVMVHFYLGDDTSQIFFGVNSDVNLYRASADNLKTDDSFTIGTNLYLATSSSIVFSGDTNLYRVAANALKTDDSFQAIYLCARPAQNADTSFQSLVGANAYPHWEVTGDGIVKWGPGSGTADVNLYRSAANVLSTDDAFRAGGMYVHRTPYGNLRHIETGSYGHSSGGDHAMTFTDAYSSNPIVVAGSSDRALMSSASSISTTGFNLGLSGAGTSYYISDGAD